ncbi:hypothetical protein NM688_g6666 [Phlebia brevispora]|uniref:Uncharacterized protein n=1 Tax=Phlebia brevispora TaxID=194682 RepID=A0ACC1SDR2_9APHY|nr:hypothetical protein NM688_g6666 [Phlebia brevispora]
MSRSLPAALPTDPQISLDMEGMDEESRIVYLREQGAHFLRSSNALLPIARIPAEVLGMIFVACAKREWFEHRTDRSRLAISHVSYRWRSVALSTPDLWSNIALHASSKDDKMQECVARAGHCPLTLAIMLGRKSAIRDPERVLSSAEKLIRRLLQAESLHVNATRADITDLQWPTAPCSSVRRLKFVEPGTTNEEHRVMPPSAGNFVTAMGMLDTLFPNLQALEAINYTFSFRHWHFPPTLTTLYVDNRDCLQGSLATEGVLQALQGIPSLENLTLIYDRSPSPQFRPESVQLLHHVSLNSLQELRLEGLMSTVIPLLAVIEVPSSIRRRISLNLDDPVYHDQLGPWWGLLTAHVREIAGDLPSVSLADSRNVKLFSFTVTAWRELRPIGGMGIADYGNLTADLQYQFVSRQPSVILQSFSSVKDVITAFPFAHVQTLRVRFLNVRFVEMLDQFAGSRTLESVGLYGVAGYLMDGLRILAPFDTFQTSPLRTLYVGDISLISAFPRLQAICEGMSKRGADFKVHITRCFAITAEQVDELRRHVSTEWDGKIVEFRRLGRTAEGEGEPLF